MVGLLLGEVVSTKKTHIVAKDVVGLPVGDIVVRMIESLTKMKTYCYDVEYVDLSTLVRAHSSLDPIRLRALFMLFACWG